MKKICGLIISAGKSERMGIPKAVLRYEHHSFLTAIIEKMSRSCDKVNVILGYRSKEIEEITLNKLISQIKIGRLDPELIKKIDFLENKNFKEGMLTSLKLGIEAAEDYDWLMYHFVDQPGLPPEFYDDFVARMEDDYDWIQPVYQDIKGHPILINRRLFGQILNISSEETLKGVDSGGSVKKKLWNCDYPEILQDLDTPFDLAKTGLTPRSVKERNDELTG